MFMWMVTLKKQQLCVFSKDYYSSSSSYSSPTHSKATHLALKRVGSGSGMEEVGDTMAEAEATTAVIMAITIITTTMAR